MKKINLPDNWNTIEKSPEKSGVYETMSLFGTSGIKKTIQSRTMFDFNKWQNDESQKVIAWKSNN